MATHVSTENVKTRVTTRKEKKCKVHACIYPVRHSCAACGFYCNEHVRRAVIKDKGIGYTCKSCGARTSEIDVICIQICCSWLVVRLADAVFC